MAKREPNLCPMCNQPVNPAKADYQYVYPWLGNPWVGWKVHKGRCLIEAAELHKENNCEDPVEGKILTVRASV